MYGAEWQQAFQAYPELSRPVAGATWPEYQRVYTTATAPPASRVFVHTDTRRPAQARHRARKPIVVRAPVVQPTATPLIRSRLTLRSAAVKRAQTATRFARRHSRTILRAPLVTAAPRRPLARPAAIRAVSRARYFTRRHTRVLRSPIAPLTVVRQAVAVVRTQTGNRSRLVARFRHRQARLLRARSLTTATPLAKPIVILSRGRIRAARARAWFPRHRVRTVKPASTPVLHTPTVRPVVVSRNSGRAAHVRASFLRHHPRIARAVATPVSQSRNAAVSRTRRAAMVRFTVRHRLRLLRAAVPAAGSSPRILASRNARRPAVVRATVRHRVRIVFSHGAAPPTRVRWPVTSTQTPHRPAVVRGYYPRHRSRLIRPTSLLFSVDIPGRVAVASRPFATVLLLARAFAKITLASRAAATVTDATRPVASVTSASRPAASVKTTDRPD